MAARTLLAFSLSDAYQEEIASTDTTSFGGLTISPGNINMSSTGKVTNLAAGTAAGDALSYGQSNASFAGLSLTANLAMGANSITGLAAPVNPGDAVNKTYADGLVSGLTWKAPVLCVATSNIAAGGIPSGLALTIDGIPANTAGQRVLLTAQSTPKNNGVWVVSNVQWTRPTDGAAGVHAANFSYFVNQGGSYADTAWVCTSDVPNDIIDTSDLAFVQFSSAGVILAGNGLTKTGNTISVKSGDGIETASNANSTNVALDASAPGLQFTGSAGTGKLQVKVDAAGGLQVAAGGVSVKAVSADRLSTSASGLDVTGVPTLFKIAGNATSANVTATNLGTLTAGSSSDASALHTHTGLNSKVSGAYTSVDALNAGDPVAWSTTNGQVNKARADTVAKSRVMGMNTNAAVSGGGTAQVVSLGSNPGILSGATAGNAFYLQATGGLSSTVPGSGNRIVEVGVAINATDLWVRIQDFGKKA